MNATYLYSSLRIDIPMHIAREVLTFSQTIPKSLMYKLENDRKYELKNEIHCTVLCGIHVANIQDIKMVFDKYRLRPFVIRFGKISYFEQSDYDVMKFEIESPYLYKINTLMRSELDYTNLFLKYKPHCTIAYVRKGVKEQQLFNIDEFILSGRECWITELTFCSKMGYHEIVPLNGQACRTLNFANENKIT